MLQCTLNLKDNYQKPVVKLGRLNALLDTGADFPTWTADKYLLEQCFGARLIKKNVEFGGFGGKESGDLKEQYGMIMSVDMGRRVTEMCNISQAIKELAIAEGRAEGIEKGIAQTAEILVESLKNSKLGISDKEAVEEVIKLLKLNDSNAQQLRSVYSI